MNLLNYKSRHFDLELWNRKSSRRKCIFVTLSVPSALLSEDRWRTCPPSSPACWKLGRGRTVVPIWMMNLTWADGLSTFVNIESSCFWVNKEHLRTWRACLAFLHFDSELFHVIRLLPRTKSRPNTCVVPKCTLQKIEVNVKMHLDVPASVKKVQVGRSSFAKDFDWVESEKNYKTLNRKFFFQKFLQNFFSKIFLKNFQRVLR